MVIAPSSQYFTLAHQIIVASILFVTMMVEISLGYFTVFHGATPKLLVAMVFLMAVFNEEDIHLVNLVVIGLIFDCLQGAPFGYTSSVLVIVNIISIIGKRRFNSELMSYLWLDFAMVMAVVMIYCWMCITVYYQSVPAAKPLIFQYSSSVLLFPVIIFLFQGILYLVEIVSRLR
ncbi:MAG: hypothetical protein CBC12_14485 [Candidatus Puniceispirillum sp. TMED52]|nr:hypothetical protein [SAR116 cluster bacterium]OUU42748.1 MAG: hypothetical protein CBC12_14485 [Candidatus Puniceispirillum sp. TMED52]